MKLKKGKGLRFGYYSNPPDFLDLLSFQTTLVIDAKINKMRCPTKEKLIFSYRVDFSIVIAMV